MAGPFSFTCACASGHRLQIYRRIFAATINLKLELQPITLIEVGHASAFDRRDMHECIRLPVVTLYEAKAFHCVEELDRAGCLFAGQLTLRSAAISTTIAAAVASLTTETSKPCSTGIGSPSILRSVAETLPPRSTSVNSSG